MYANGVGITSAAGTRLVLKIGHERLRGPHHSICHRDHYDRLRGGGGGYVHISHTPTTPQIPSLSLSSGGGGYVHILHTPHHHPSYPSLSLRGGSGGGVYKMGKISSQFQN